MNIGDPVFDMVLSDGHPKAVNNRHEANGSHFGFGGGPFLGNERDNDMLEHDRPVSLFLNFVENLG